VLGQRSEKVWLLEWLNTPQSDLVALVTDLKQMEATGRELAPMFRSPEVTRMIDWIGSGQQDAVVESLANRKVEQSYAPFRAREEAINRKLAAYASYPKLFYNIRAGRWFSTQSGQEQYPKDWLTITFLVQLVVMRRLDRLRRCLNCHRWFLARTANQECCSEKSRKKYRSRDPKFKAGRVKYMRDHRKQEKDRDLANLKARKC